VDGIKVVHPLDPCLGPRYIKPVDHNMESDTLDQLYTITIGMRPDYINPTIDGSVSWRSIHSVDEDSEVAFESWKQGSYERFSRRCAIVRETRWIATEVREHSTYNGTLKVHSFLTSMEEEITMDQRIFVLDVALQDTPTQWWATHKALITRVGRCKTSHLMSIPK
jgi:hypothetical protein